MTKKEKEKKKTAAEIARESRTDIELIERDLEKTRLEAAEYLDSLQRLKAEFENFRKRMIKEQSEFLAMATQNIVMELLPVIDSFERALSHADQAGADDFQTGVQILYNQLKEILVKQGLKAIDPLNEKFDPLKHEAMMQVETGEHEENTVVEVFEKGYELKGRVIRPAKVKVVR